jgi:BolA protein
VSQDRPDRIRQELETQFAPTELLVKDQSHLHAGHAGAKDGKGHFDVTIVSAAFDGKNRVQRHQMIYDALRDLLQTDIHALSIKAFTPSER